MSRRTRDRQRKTPREKHTAKQRCGRKKQLTEDEARWVSKTRREGGAAAWTCHPYRCGDHWHTGHLRGGSWSR